MWFYYWYGEINELLKKFRFWLTTFGLLFTQVVPRIYIRAPSLNQALVHRGKVELIQEFITTI